MHGEQSLPGPALGYSRVFGTDGRVIDNACNRVSCVCGRVACASVCGRIWVRM